MESTHMRLLDHLTSQTSLNISTIWTAVITGEVKKLQLSQMQTEWENLFPLCWYRKGYIFFPVAISTMIVL
jgi:hypothetical protein